MATPQPEALFYVAEQTSPDDNKIENLQVKNGPGSTWWVEFDTCLHVFEFMNRNTRQYLGDNCMECIGTEKIQSQLANNGWYGEQDHPFPLIDGQKLSEKRIRTIYLPNRSHKIINPQRKGDRLFAHIESAANDVGKGFRDEVVQGLIPCFSARVFGTLRLVNGKPTIIVKILVTYDWVLYPGFKDAKMIGKANAKVGALPITESAEDETRDAFIPIEELAKDVAEKDSTVNAFMESYDLDASSIVGFEGDRAVLSPDRDHYFYPKMNKQSVNMVRDFYRSFK